MTTRRRTTSTLVAGGLAAAIALVGCGTEQAGSGSGSGLPLLRIGAAGAVAQADSGKGGGDNGYQLDGTLPDGPSSAPVARFDGAPSEDEVRALAAALGIGADLERRDHGWIVQDREGVLRVRSDASGLWAFSRSSDECPSYSIDIDSPGGADTGVSSCAVAVDGGETPGAAKPVPVDDDALAAAQPVLDAVGLDEQPTLSPTDGRTVRTVSVDPVVAGLPTVGLRTFVDVDVDGVSGAMGWLGDAAAGDEYPLISAKTAFDRLVAMPRPLPAIGCPETTEGPDVGAPDFCGQPQTVVVTGAELGLMLAWEGRAPILVPAWHFAVDGWTDPLAAVAVEDRYLADPEPIGGGGASTEPSAGTGGGVEPGNPGSGEPVEPPATDPGTDPGLSPEPVPAVPNGVAIEKAAVSDDGRTLKLTGWGGVCAEYSAIADEAADAVKVQILGRSTLGPNEACIEIAKEITVTVTLEAPLGDRAVVDATTGATVPTA